MVFHTWNLCSAFNPSKCAHTVNSQCCGARGAVGGSMPCSRVSPQSWYWGWRERWTFTPPTYNPCRTWDSNPQPSGYKSDSLTIRLRLPHLAMLCPRNERNAFLFFLCSITGFENLAWFDTTSCCGTSSITNITWLQYFELKRGISPWISKHAYCTTIVYKPCVVK